MGKSAAADVVLDHPRTMSRKLARLSPEGRKWFGETVDAEFLRPPRER
jgi:hypothetical protein